MKKLSLLTLFGLFLSLIVSCSSPGDELVGSWEGTISSRDEYTQYRFFSQDKNFSSCLSKITFNKIGSDGKGTFTDEVKPIAFGKPTFVFVGTVLTGTWCVKGDKLHLYYNTDVKITHTEGLPNPLIEYYEDEFSRYYMKDFKDMAASGLSYKIKKNDKHESLTIYYGHNQQMKYNKD